MPVTERGVMSSRKQPTVSRGRDQRGRRDNSDED